MLAPLCPPGWGTSPAHKSPGPAPRFTEEDTDKGQGTRVRDKGYRSSFSFLTTLAYTTCTSLLWLLLQPATNLVTSNNTDDSLIVPEARSPKSASLGGNQGAHKAGSLWRLSRTHSFASPDFRRPPAPPGLWPLSPMTPASCLCCGISHSQISLLQRHL